MDLADRTRTLRARASGPMDMSCVDERWAGSNKEPLTISDAGLRSLTRLARLQLQENTTDVLGLIRGVSPSDWNRTYAISLETRRR